jgi:septal ring factor EnvC (AmiA/AmiB activator)
MQRVKEEFFLSLIFVLKWLSLALGVLGILYFAISLAYHRSYYDPLMKKYELEIAELHKQKRENETSLSRLQESLNQIETQIDILKQTQIPAAKDAISLHEKKIEALNEDFIDRYNPFSEKSEEIQKIYDDRDKAVEHKEKLDEQLENLLLTQAIKGEMKSEMLQKIDQIGIFISVEENEKEKVGTGALGVLPWLFGILGLT